MGIFDIFKSEKKERKCLVCQQDLVDGVLCQQCGKIVHKKCMKKYKRTLICTKCFKEETKSNKKMEKAYWNIKQMNR